MHTLFTALAGNAVIHPGATALVWTRKQVQIELTLKRAIGMQNLEKAHIAVPNMDPIGTGLALFNANAIQALHNFEQPTQDAINWKPRTQLFIGEVVLSKLQLFRDIGNIPGLKCTMPNEAFAKSRKVCSSVLAMGMVRCARSRKKAITSSVFRAILVANESSA